MPALERLQRGLHPSGWYTDNLKTLCQRQQHGQGPQAAAHAWTEDSLIIYCLTVLAEVDDGAGQAGREGEGVDAGKGAASAAVEAAPATVLQLLCPVRMRKMWAKTWNKTYLLSLGIAHTGAMWLHSEWAR